MSVYVYDLEQFPNLHTATFKNIHTKEVKTFVLHESRFELQEYLAFLNTVKGLIGFNNIGYDYPMLKKIRSSYNKDISLIKELYTYSQYLINNDKPPIFKQDIPQLDLYKINHYDNKNKRTSLKWVEFGLKWDNLQDLPYPHDAFIESDQIQTVLDYNLNDVNATEKFYEHCKPQIELRKSLSKIYGINLINHSDTGIGMEILKREYAKKTKIPEAAFTHWYDSNTNITFSSVISDVVSFKSFELQELLSALKSSNQNIFYTEFKRSVLYDSMYYTIAKGGLHSEKTGTFLKADDKYSLIDIDFGSFYPKLMLNLKIYPPQLGESFLEVLQDLTDRRLHAKAINDKATAESLKITINSIFGNLGEKNSFIYSPQSLYKVTINGQLILLMLIEKLTKLGASCFYANTDGATFKVPKSKLHDFMEACKAFESYIDIPIEYAEYDMCAIRDVNNYIILGKNNYVKTKGAFEIEKPLHKNNSQKIVAKAVYEYFINNKPVETTINNHTELLDFCKVVRTKKDDYLISRIFDKSSFVDTKLSKTNRYYVSNNGVTLIKIMPPLEVERVDTPQLNLFNVDEYNIYKPREVNIESGYKCTLHNQLNTDITDINYNYYISESYKLINSILQ